MLLDENKSLRSQGAQLNVYIELLEDKNSNLSSQLNALTGKLNSSFQIKRTITPNFQIVYYYGIDEYADAILNVLDTALEGFQQLFDPISCEPSTMPIDVFIVNSPSLEYAVARSFNYNIYIETNNAMLSTKKGWIGLLVHELSHIMLNVDINAFNEGWAMYSPMVRIVDYVYRQLGDQAWPQPYNYSRYEGIERFLDTLPQQYAPGNLWAAAKIFYEIDQKHGSHTIGSAIYKLKTEYMPWLITSPYPKFNLSDFKDALVNLTNDTTIYDLFRENGF